MCNIVPVVSISSSLAVSAYCFFVCPSPFLFFHYLTRGNQNPSTADSKLTGATYNFTRRIHTYRTQHCRCKPSPGFITTSEGGILAGPCLTYRTVRWNEDGTVASNWQFLWGYKLCQSVLVSHLQKG